MESIKLNDNEALTSEKLEDLFGNNVYKAVEFTKNLKPAYPEKPNKPLLSKNHTSAEAQLYSKLLSEHEDKMIEYQENKKIYDVNINEIDNKLEVYIKEVSGLNYVVPEQYRNKVYNYAYQEGHSNGFSEIYNCLLGLIEIFE